MSSKKNDEKSCKHLVRRAMAVSERSKKKSPAAQASGDSAMLLHSVFFLGVLPVKEKKT